MRKDRERCIKQLEEEMKPGVAAGLYPEGPWDEGELKVSVASHNDLVFINFGKRVRWFGLTKTHAIELAKLIMSKCGVVEIKYRFGNAEDASIVRDGDPAIVSDK